MYNYDKTNRNAHRALQGRRFRRHHSCRRGSSHTKQCGCKRVCRFMTGAAAYPFERQISTEVRTQAFQVFHPPRTKQGILHVPSPHDAAIDQSPFQKNKSSEREFNLLPWPSGQWFLPLEQETAVRICPGASRPTRAICWWRHT